jgi:hypothetical protein
MNIRNILSTLLACRIVPTYKVTYAPADSRKPELPVQVYNILGHPKKLAWKSHAGNRLFTAVNARHTDKFIAFRADRTLSVNFSGFAFLTPKVSKAFKGTLISVASPVAPAVCGCASH